MTDIPSGEGDERLIESRTSFIEFWRHVARKAKGGHEMVANANTVSRFVRIVDALVAEAESAQASLTLAGGREEELEKALRHIDALEPMELNPSNYDHDDVCELNRNAAHAADLARDALSLLLSHTLGKGEEGASSVSVRAGADAPKATAGLAGQETRNFVHHFYSELRLSEKRELFEKYGLPFGDGSVPDAVRWKAGLVEAKERGVLNDMARDMGLLPPAECSASLSSEASARKDTRDAPKDLPGLPTPSLCQPKEGG